MNYTDATTSQKAEFRAQREIYRATTTLEFLHAYRDVVDEIGVIPSVLGDYIDFDSLTRPQLLTLLKRFPGKWDKRPGYDGGLIYQRRERILKTANSEGFAVRIYNGEPPAACVIEEKVEYIEVPARTERRVTRTVVCPEPATASE